MSADIATLRRILRECRTIAIVGLSDQWHRPSYFAAKYLQQHGYRIIPVNPRLSQVLGERCYASLDEVDVAIDMVDIFRRTQDVAPIVDQAIRLGVRCVWQQLGVVDLESQARALQCGLDAIVDRCVKIEHARLYGGLHWAGVNTWVISARRAA